MEYLSKTTEARLRDCEAHLFFLWDARRLSNEQRDRYKQVAAELRVLVADHNPKYRLLLVMMDDFEFDYNVQPQSPPFDMQPITMVGWRKDPEYQKLTQQVQDAMGDPQKLKNVVAAQKALRRPVPLSEYVESGLAVFIKPYDYSYGRLVRDIAQQMGSGHEGLHVDVPLAQMGNIVIGGEESHIVTLLNFADLIIHVGQLFIGHMVKEHGYEPKYFSLGEA